MGLPDPAEWRVVGEAIATGAGMEEARAVVGRSRGLTRRDEMLFRLGLGRT